MQKSALIIPVFKPSQDFPELIESFYQLDFKKIIVVDDGSGRVFNKIFGRLEYDKKLVFLRHKKNKGKGAAIKTALKVCINNPSIQYAITADADGQHATHDIRKIADRTAFDQESKLFLGKRSFDRNVPFRSLLGNIVTKNLFFGLYGERISDTQTGLRAIPRKFFSELITVPYDRYEFEMEMLILAVKQKYPIEEIDIETIYLNENKNSHFNPINDSMKIYFVMGRLGLSSLSTFVVDYTVFLICYYFTNSLASSVILGRLIAFPVYFYLTHGLAFKVMRKTLGMIARLSFVVCLLGLISYFLQTYLALSFNTPVFLNKIIIETSLFIVSFYVLRDFVYGKEVGTNSKS